MYNTKGLITQLEHFLKNASWSTVDDVNTFIDGDLKVEIKEYVTEDWEGNWGLTTYSVSITNTLTNDELFHEYHHDALNYDIDDIVKVTINYLRTL